MAAKGHHRNKSEEHDSAELVDECLKDIVPRAEPKLVAQRDPERKAVRRLGPRDPLLRYIRSDGRLFEVRVPLEKGSNARISLGLYGDHGSARRALRLYIFLQSSTGSPFLARTELARRLGRPQPMPRWVRRCCLTCRWSACDHCRCRRRKVAPVFGYLACIRVPGAKASLGPFPAAAMAHQAARQYIAITLGARARPYLAALNGEG